MADIFISYSRKDSEIVHRIVSELEQEGFDLWIDRDGIESGDAFKHVIVNALSTCKVVVFFASEASNASSWTEKEINVAIEEKLPIIPIRLDDSKYSPGVRLDLAGLDYIDMTVPEKREGMLTRLKSSLRKKLGVSDAKFIKETPARQEPLMSPAFNLTEEDIETSKCIRRAKISFSKRYHYVNLTTNRIVIPDRFEECDERFTNGFAHAKKNGKWGCIDMRGNVIIPFEYDALSGITTHMIARRNSKEGVIDLHNRIIIPFNYSPGTFGILEDDRAFEFHKNKLVGLFADNRFIVPCDYDSILTVCPGVFELHSGNEYRLCDIKGRIISQPVWPLGKEGKNGTFRKWVFYCDSNDSPILLVGLKPNILPFIETDGSIKELDSCGIIGVDGFSSVSPIEKVIREANGRIFVCTRNLWGEIKLPVWNEKIWEELEGIRPSFFSLCKYPYYFGANLSILAPFMYESIDDLKRQNG